MRHRALTSDAIREAGFAIGRCPSNRHDAICVRRGWWARSSGVRRLFCGLGHRTRARTVPPRGKGSERTSVQNWSISKLKKRSFAT